MIDQEFTGEKLLQLVLSVEGAVGLHRACITPLGIKIIQLCEEAVKKDTETGEPK